MMKNKGAFRALTGFAVALLALASVAQAQVTLNGKSKERVKRLISETERSSNAFRTALENRFGAGLLRGTRAQSVAKTRVQALDQRLERLARDIDRAKDPSTIRIGVKESIQLAGPVQSVLRRNPAVARAAGKRWAALRADLNRLAKLYNTPGVGRL